MIVQMLKKSWVSVVLVGSTLMSPMLANAESAVNTAIVSPSSRQMPSDSSLEKLMVVQQFDKSLEDINKQVQGMIAPILQKSFNNLPKNENLTAEQNVKIQKALENFIQDMIKEQSSPANRLKFKQAFIESAKATYSQQEVDAMIAFYGSPIGQQIVGKQSQFTASYMQKVINISQEQQLEMINTKLPKLLQQIEKITGKPISK